MQTTQTTDQGASAVHLHLDAMYEGHDELAALLQDLVTAAQSGDQSAIDQAAAAIHLDQDAMYGQEHDDLAELLDDLVTAAQAEAPAQDAAA